MELDKILASLEAAKGDPNAMALATVDFVLDSYSPGFTSALEAAAVPHWFDESVLQVLLHKDVPVEADWFNILLKLTFVEEFCTHNAWNVHEVTRLALRARLAKNKPERFIKLSAKAASCFSGEAHDKKIERIYHLLAAKPDEGARELRRQWREWATTGAIEPLQALGISLRELCEQGILEPRARAYSKVALLNIQSDRVDLNVQMDTVQEAIDLNSDLRDVIGLVDSYLGLGEVLRKKGHHTKALSAFEQARESLDKWDQSQMKYESLDMLAEIHTAIGRTLSDRGERERALTEFEAALDVRHELNEIDTKDVGSRRNLAIAIVDLGDALVNTDRHTEAKRHFTTSLSLLENLPEESKSQDITFDIGKIHMRLGSYLASKGELESSEKAIKKAGEILDKLLSVDPENFGVRREVANVQLLFFVYHLTKKELEQAEECLSTAQKIFSELLEADPVNPNWKGESASLRQYFGLLRENQQRYEEAIVEYLEAEKILTDLKESYPDSVSWLLQLAYIQTSLGNLLKWAIQSLDRKESENLLLRMFTILHECRNTRSALVELDPTNTYWKELLAESEQKLAAGLVIIAEQIDKGLDLQSETEITAEGIRTAALDRYGKCVVIYSDLIANDPVNTRLIQNIATSATEGALLLESMGDAENALKTYQAAAKYYENLTQIKPDIEGYATKLKSVKEAITRLESD